LPSKSWPREETALAPRDSSLDPWREPGWQSLWLALQARPWSSLAIVPAAEGAPRDFGLRIAVTLSRVGMVHLRRPIHVADATGVPLATLTQFMEEVGRCTQGGDLILITVGPVTASPLTVSIAQSTDVALLCVLLDRMSNAETRRTVAKIGHNRFAGSAIFRGDGLDMSPASGPLSTPGS